MDWNKLPGELIHQVLCYVDIKNTKAVLSTLEALSQLNHHWKKYVSSSDLFQYGQWLHTSAVRFCGWNRILNDNINTDMILLDWFIMTDNAEDCNKMLHITRQTVWTLLPDAITYERTIEKMRDCAAVSMLDWIWNIASPFILMSPFINMDFVVKISDAAVLRWYLNTVCTTADELCHVHFIVMAKCCGRVMAWRYQYGCDWNYKQIEQLLWELLSTLPFPLTAHQSVCAHLIMGIYQTKKQRLLHLYDMCHSVLCEGQLEPIYCPDYYRYDPKITFVERGTTHHKYFRPKHYPGGEYWRLPSYTTRINMLHELPAHPMVIELFVDALLMNGYYIDFWSKRSLTTAALYLYRQLLQSSCYPLNLILWILFRCCSLLLVLYWTNYSLPIALLYIPLSYLCLSFAFYFCSYSRMRRVTSKDIMYQCCMRNTILLFS